MPTIMDRHKRHGSHQGKRCPGCKIGWHCGAEPRPKGVCWTQLLNPTGECQVLQLETQHAVSGVAGGSAVPHPKR